MSYLSAKIGGPSLNVTSVTIRPIKASLGVLVFSLYRAGIDFEKEVTAVASPLDVLLNGFIMSDLPRRLSRGRKIKRVDLKFFYSLVALRNRLRHKRESSSIGRSCHLLDPPRSAGQSSSAGSGVGNFVWIICGRTASRGSTRDRVGHRNAEHLVSAFDSTVLADVLPIFLVSLLLGFSPRRAGGKVEDARVGGPGECMNLFITLRNRKRFPAGERDQIKLTDLLVSGGLFTGLSSLTGVAFGEESDPAAIWRPLRLGIVAGLCKLNQTTSAAPVVTVKREIIAEYILVPVGAVGRDHERLTVRRQLQPGKFDVVEELVESDLWIAGRFCKSER